MKILKLVVLFMCLSYVRSVRNKYCEICANHTLCVYPVAGPSTKCSKYNSAVSLTASDRVEIVNRINEKRNFIAMGRLYPFPEAANMKKIMWSTELATMAQRWVDQCDQSVKPDKKDHCRDLAHMQVGQNIATVVGPSPGINVKSLIDMWFMENIYFTGTVTYYNQTSNSRARNFAQLIWAETEFVGCGKAQFYIEELRTMVLRLVCNFAPSGNHHGKPMYIIGLPSTQCSRNTVPSRQFLGLCQRTKQVTMFTVEAFTARSLLRILNLSNDSMKQELDPNNSKQTNLNNSQIYNKRHQKTRHTYFNKHYGAVKRDSFHIDPSVTENYKNHQFTPERGRSRMYHGHQTRNEPQHSSEPVKSYTEQNFRRIIDFTTIPPLPYTEKNYRKYFMNGPQECTRKIQMNDDNIRSGCDIADGCCPKDNKWVTNECTRGHAQNCKHKLNICQNTPCPPNPCQRKPSHQAICSCSEHTACSTPATECAHSSTCQFSSQICPLNPPPALPCAIRRSEGGEVTKSTPYNHYDLLPNIEVRSGDRKFPLDDSWYHDTVGKEELPIIGKIRNSYLNQQVKPLHDNSQNKGLVDPQDSYHYFDSSARKIRDLKGQTFKPFWQVDEYSLNKPSELKSIRYTTLNRRRKKPLNRQTSVSFITSTETITINLKDMSKNSHVSEKYLSFDELMYLRKLNSDYPYVYDGRRGGKNFLRDDTTAAATTEATTTEATTTEATKPSITVNTPFIRLKQCTRKITCTWTVRMKPMNGNGSIDIGPTTPHGYVDGCTRTSTCTRDFMGRNKFDTLAPEKEGDDDVGSTDGGASGDTFDDYVDYCQRRDLNVRRRDVSKNKATCLQSTESMRKETVTEMSVKTKTTTSSNKNIEIQSTTTDASCVCYKDTVRSKRHNYKAYEEYSKNQFSSWRRELNALPCLKRTSRKSKVSYKCPCGSSEPTQAVGILFIFMKCMMLILL